MIPHLLRLVLWLVLGAAVPELGDVHAGAEEVQHGGRVEGRAVRPQHAVHRLAQAGPARLVGQHGQQVRLARPLRPPARHLEEAAGEEQLLLQLGAGLNQLRILGDDSIGLFNLIQVS